MRAYVGVQGRALAVFAIIPTDRQGRLALAYMRVNRRRTGGAGTGLRC